MRSLQGNLTNTGKLVIHATTSYNGTSALLTSGTKPVIVDRGTLTYSGSSAGVTLEVA